MRLDLDESVCDEREKKKKKKQLLGLDCNRSPRFRNTICFIDSSSLLLLLLQNVGHDSRHRSNITQVGQTTEKLRLWMISETELGL